MLFHIVLTCTNFVWRYVHPTPKKLFNPFTQIFRAIDQNCCGMNSFLLQTLSHIISVIMKDHGKSHVLKHFISLGKNVSECF